METRPGARIFLLVGRGQRRWGGKKKINDVINKIIG